MLPPISTAFNAHYPPPVARVLNKAILSIQGPLTFPIPFYGLQTGRDESPRLSDSCQENPQARLTAVTRKHAQTGCITAMEQEPSHITTDSVLFP